MLEYFHLRVPILQFEHLEHIRRLFSWLLAQLRRAAISRKMIHIGEYRIVCLTIAVTESGVFR